LGRGTFGRQRGLLDRRILAGLLTAGALVILTAVGYMSGGGVAGAAYYYYYTGPGPPANLTLAPPTASNPVGTSHTVTATVTDSSAAAVPGTLVRFTVTGSVARSGQCTTDAAGQCTFTYAGPALAGSDAISAFADTDTDGNVDPDEPTATATKTWVLPPSTLGTVTGSGQILVGDAKVSFDLSAKSDSKGVKGSCSVNDQGTGRKIKCTDATVLVVSGNKATIYGNATDNGVLTTYAIEVHDNSTSGAGSDTFSITTASGYTASGTLTTGNIQTH
jgi:hypothetical protein